MTPPRGSRPARGRTRIASAAGIVWALGPGGALATPGTAVPAGGGVVLEVEDCPSLDQAVLRQLVTIEIGDLLLPPRSKPRVLAPERLTIRCDGGRIHLVVAGAAASAAPVERTLDAGDFPGDAAPRALALAGIEMLAALSPTVRRRVDARQGIASTPTSTPVSTTTGNRYPAGAAAPRAQGAASDQASADESALARDAEADGDGAPPAPPAADARTPAAATPPEEPSGSAPRNELLIGFAAVRRSFLVPRGVSAWGANVGADREVGSRWLYRVDVEGDAASQTGALGDASALLVSLGGFVGMRLGRSDFSAALAVGGRLGLVRLSGSPVVNAAVQGSSVLRGWGGPALTARLLSGAGRLGLSLSAEGGWALIGAEGSAQQTVVVAVRGFWLGAGAGIWF